MYEDATFMTVGYWQGSEHYRIPLLAMGKLGPGPTTWGWHLGVWTGHGGPHHPEGVAAPESEINPQPYATEEAQLSSQDGPRRGALTWHPCTITVGLWEIPNWEMDW